MQWQWLQPKLSTRIMSNPAWRARPTALTRLPTFSATLMWIHRDRLTLKAQSSFSVPSEEERLEAEDSSAQAVSIALMQTIASN